MADNIALTVDERPMFMGKLRAWWSNLYKQSGKIIGDKFAPGDWLKEFNFRYESYHPCHPKDGTPYEDGKVIYRSDTDEQISMVSKSYEVMQPEEFVQLIEEALREYNEASLVSMVGLDCTRMLAATAELPSKDGTSRLVSFGTSCNYVRPIWAAISQIVIVCCNTESAVWNGSKDKFSIRHTKNWRDRVQDLVWTMNLAPKMLDALDEFKHCLEKCKTTPSDEKKIIMDIAPAPTPTPRMKAKGVGYSERTLNKWRNINTLVKSGRHERTHTALDIFNGVTEFESNPQRRSHGNHKKPTASSVEIGRVYGSERKLLSSAYTVLSDRYSIELPSLKEMSN